MIIYMIQKGYSRYMGQNRKYIMIEAAAFKLAKCQSKRRSQCMTGNSSINEGKKIGKEQTRK
jgi:hypothetical protein